MLNFRFNISDYSVFIQTPKITQADLFRLGLFFWVLWALTRSFLLITNPFLDGTGYKAR